MRKFFHTSLIKLTSNRKQVYKLFTAIDKHSEKVQRKHYILESPEDDAELAKLLCKTVLGGTVDWPSSEAVYRYMAAQEIDTSEWLRLLQTDEADLFESLSEGEGGDGDDNDDAEELEAWEFGRCFGINSGAGAPLPLCDELADAQTGTDLVAHMSEPPDRRPHKEEKEKKSKRRSRTAARQASDASAYKKNKKEKKERRKSKQSAASRQPSEDSPTNKRNKGEREEKKRMDRSSNAHERPAADATEGQDAASKNTRIGASEQPASSSIVAPQRPMSIGSGLEQGRKRTRLTPAQLDKYAAYELPAAAGPQSRSDTILSQSYDSGCSGRSTHHASWRRVLQSRIE